MAPGERNKFITKSSVNKQQSYLWYHDICHIRFLYHESALSKLYKNTGFSGTNTLACVFLVYNFPISVKKPHVPKPTHLSVKNGSQLDKAWGTTNGFLFFFIPLQHFCLSFVLLARINQFLNLLLFLYKRNKKFFICGEKIYSFKNPFCKLMKY